MYFDIDYQVEVPESRLEDALASAAREISARRGRVIAMSREILVFSAPLWRFYGLAYFFVRQLPLGISHGVVQVLIRDGVRVVRCRVSLLWLRLYITAIVLLLMYSAFTPGAGNKAIRWIVLLASIVLGGMIYTVAVVGTRRFFKKLFLDDQEDTGAARTTALLTSAQEAEGVSAKKGRSEIDGTAPR